MRETQLSKCTPGTPEVLEALPGKRCAEDQSSQGCELFRATRE